MTSPEPACLGEAPRASTSVPVVHVEPVRQRVMRQLLEAVLFEGLVPYRCVDAADARRQWLSFPLGTLEARCRGYVRGFGRIHLDMDSLSLTRDGRRVSADLEDLVGELPAPVDQRLALLADLEATIRNTHRCRRHPDRRELAAEALDCALHEGHPYHPCFKARSGFSEDDQERYAPESGRDFRLHWLAVPRAQLLASLPPDEQAFWERELGAESARSLRDAFHRAGADWCVQTALPVHPWQWQHLRHAGLAPALARGEVISLGELGDRYRASQSLRSLFNVSRPGEACVKLPLGIGNTSSRRHLEPHSVPSAPAISRWLQETVDGDPRFARDYPLRLLAEYASLLYTGQPDHPAEGRALAGELGVIWRQGIEPRLGRGERAVPLNALCVREADGHPFIQPWIERYGAGPWLEAVIRAVVLPVWHLAVAHGIAVEAHAQNSLLVMRDGWPVALMLRDFHDSVEYVEDFLPASASGPAFAERQPLYDRAPDDLYYRMGQVEALRELVMDTLFVFNLSELALTMETHYRIPEPLFWRRVRCCLEDHARRHPELADRQARLAHRQPRIATESLITRKLRGPDSPECHHLVPNALAEPRDPDNREDNCEDHRG